ncbi:hypothetical protein ACFT5D_07740 [Streptomyces sp. NPDC057144]|uniref:hypothetical protein n=1 Tax=Streptomyces sp. NPDC057144 TaxID=3346034 RepID=UPI0036294418
MANAKKRFGVIVASLLLAVGGGLMTSPQASAASCYGDYCSNKDPQATGCSAGGFTQFGIDVYYWKSLWASNKAYAGRLELRGSNTCGSTQWARFTAMDTGFTYRIRAEQPETGYTTSWQEVNTQRTSAWSNQIYSPRLCVRAHIQLWDAGVQRTDGYTKCR